MAPSLGSLPSERTLLIVEDDKSFLQRLAKALEARGFEVTAVETVAEGLTQVEQINQALAGDDRRPPHARGLDALAARKRRRPEARAVILFRLFNSASA